MTWDEGLHEGQKEAAGRPLESYVLLAGPGTGKTFVLVRRIQFLVEEQGLDPATITVLSFTRAAAAEMKQRLDERFQAFRVRVSTLHSYALRELISRAGADILRPVRVVDDWEERSVVVEELARMLGRRVNEITNRSHTGALDLLADDWDTLNADEDDWEEGHADPAFLSAWQRHREVYGYTLRSELVYQLLQEIRADPDFQPSSETRVLLVDEYQDLNSCDLQTIQGLVERTGASLLAAGDDDQSIYSFRHAVPAGIRGFADSYPGSGQSIMTECLRCGQAVVDLGNWLIEQEEDRIPKELQSVTERDADVALIRFGDHNEEAHGVARLIESEVQSGTLPHEVLVVLKSDRGERVSSALSEQLSERGIDTYLPRSKAALPLDAQRLLEYLKLSESLREGVADALSVRSLMELEPNEIGSTRIRTILEFALEARIGFLEAIDRLRVNPDDFDSTGIAAVLNSVDFILQSAEQLQHSAGEDLGAWVDRVAHGLELDEDAVELIAAAAEQVRLSLEDIQGGIESAPINYVQELSAALAGVEGDKPAQMEDHVTVTSMHGAKGLSADVVFVLQAEDEVIPDGTAGAEFRESRRLLYVSVTRARKRLYIGFCSRRAGGQEWVRDRRHWNRTLTRFLNGYGLEASTVDAILGA